MPKNTLKVSLDNTQKLQKKLSKINEKRAKRNQGKQAFLGILACLLGSQYDMHSYARYDFKLWKKQLLHASYIFPLKCHAKKKWVLYARSIQKWMSNA